MIRPAWLTAALPLNDSRDIWARIGFRFVFATGPYFLLAFLSHDDRLLRGFLPCLMIALPFFGSAIDWVRLSRRVEPPRGAAIPPA